MTEFEKMGTGEFYDFTDAEVHEAFSRCHDAMTRFNALPRSSVESRRVLKEIVPTIPDSSRIVPPFYCDFGNGIRIGENSFVNMNCTFLDSGGITIGSRTKLGPNCQLYTPQHPLDYMERRKPIERGLAIRIGDDCWLGGGVVVCPGVRIGDRCIIGAGSVVTRDIPDDSLAAGNPAVVKRKLQ